MAVVFDVGNSANWNLIYAEEKTAQDAPAPSLNKFYPIPDFSVPVQLNSPLSAIYCTSDTDPGNWKRAGFAKQKLATGITVGGLADAYLSVVPIYLKQINLVKFEKVTTSYVLDFSIPFWLRHINLYVWEYIGIIDDTFEQQLDDIEAKIDQLL